MWIRTQDKKTLVKVDMVELLNYENSIVAYTSIKVADLGKYSTEEKAMKVLNDIEETMCYGNGSGFYQMPQDDEVEE